MWERLNSTLNVTQLLRGAAAWEALKTSSQGSILALLDRCRHASYETLSLQFHVLAQAFLLPGLDSIVLLSRGII
jgi:hypothetical protein